MVLLYSVHSKLIPVMRSGHIHLLYDTTDKKRTLVCLQKLQQSPQDTAQMKTQTHIPAFHMIRESNETLTGMYNSTMFYLTLQAPSVKKHKRNMTKCQWRIHLKISEKFKMFQGRKIVCIKGKDVRIENLLSSSCNTSFT